jgi:hypothetical protein
MLEEILVSYYRLEGTDTTLMNQLHFRKAPAYVYTTLLSI